MINVSIGNITIFEGDCIVNAANAALCGSGGVDGAIHRVAGSQLLAECRQLGHCPSGEVRFTNAYNLKVKYIIHAVGPVWYGGNKGEKECLKSCYLNSLNLCKRLDINSVAFPNISCGAYRFPHELAAKIAIKSVKSWFSANSDYLLDVHFVCFEKKHKYIYDKLLKDDVN